MRSLFLSHTVHALVGGILVFLIGNIFLGKAAKVRRRGRRPSRLILVVGYALVLLGVAAAGTGAYAGLLGPVRVARFVLHPFKFAPTSATSYLRSLNYVRKNLEISSKPAVGWHGASNKALEYTVNNKGNRNVACLVLRFKTRPGPGQTTIEATLHGPFPPRQKTRKVVEVPMTVNRRYFDNISEVDYDHVIGAQF
jgi:hypothetical protein